MRVLIALLITTMFVAPVSLGSSESAGPCREALDPTVHRDAALRFDRVFAQLFPGHDLVVTQDWSRLPTIPEFWAAGPDGFCAVDDLATLLGVTDTTLGDQVELEAAAWLVAQTTDEAKLGELMLRDVVSFTPTDEGAHVVLHATSEQTGTLVEYVVDVDRLGRGTATWTVIEIVDGLRQNWEGWFLDVGRSGPYDASAGISAVALFPTHDGKNVRINYNPAVYANPTDEAEDVARNGNGGVIAYNTIHRDWGFPSDDPDSFLDITLDGCACIFGGNNVNIHMPPHLQAWIAAVIPGLWYPDEDGVVTDVVGHEFFHHFQYSIMNWNNGQFVIEGTARFAETAFTPEYCHVPGSLHWLPNVNGFSYLAMNPHLTPGSHWYSYGLFWGHLYDTNGGIDIIRRVLEESAVNPSGSGFVDRALATDGVAHTYWAEALADFGVRLAARDMVWDRWDGSASYDWLAYAPPTGVTHVPVSATGPAPTSEWTTGVSQLAVRIGVLGHAGATDTAAVALASSADHVARLVSTSGGDTTVTPLTPVGAAVDDASDYRAVVIARGLPNVAPVNVGPPSAPPRVAVVFG